MGQIAEDIIHGRCCELCGCYFKNTANPDQFYEHGYSVTCKPCYKDLTPDEKKFHKQAKAETL